jgi:hypothetical protein
MTEGQIIQWPEEKDIRTDNTMARRKRQGQIIQWPHCIICPSVFFFWPLYYLSFCLFLLAIVLSVLSFSFGHCIICPSNGQKKKTGQIIQWPKEKDRRTDNTMAKRKRQKDR